MVGLRAYIFVGKKHNRISNRILNVGKNVAERKRIKIGCRVSVNRANGKKSDQRVFAEDLIEGKFMKGSQRVLKEKAVENYYRT